MSSANIHSIRRKTPIRFCAALLAVMSATASSAATSSVREVLSFEMWCLDIQVYAPARCDTRRNDDVKDYEHYRAAVESFNRQRTDQEKRDQQLQDQLKRDPSAAKR